MVMEVAVILALQVMVIVTGKAVVMVMMITHQAWW